MRSVLQALFAFMCSAAAPALVSAQLLYEPFNYPDGPLEGRTNSSNARAWAAMGTGDDDVSVGGGSLAVRGLGLVHSAGKSASYQGQGKTERLAIGTNIVSGSAYYSLAFTVNDYGNLFEFPFGVFFVGFNNSTGSSTSQPGVAGTRLLVRPGTLPDAFHVGLAKNSGSAPDFAFTLTNYALGESIFVVGRYTIGPGTDDDESALWINPSTTFFGAATPPDPTLTNSVGADLTNGVRSIVLRQGHDGVPHVTVDEIRVATTWAGATNIPEPGSVAMVAFFVWPAILLRRRPRREGGTRNYYLSTIERT